MIRRYSELKPKIPTPEGISPNIEGSSEALEVFLSPINSKEIQYRIGIEKLVKTIPLENGQIQITKSEYSGWRYLFVNKTGDIISAIQGVSQGKKNIISNIYTRPEDRNKGFANALLNQVKQDRKEIVVDSHMTQQGSKFLHYSQLKCAALSGEQANRRAIRKYGLTSDPSSIGFITPKGQCIDSSGRSQGSQSSGRNIDHREIAQDALGDDALDSTEDTLQKFLDLTGNVRVIGAVSEVSIQVPIKEGIPTKKQLGILEGMAKGKEVFFDITSNGRTVQSGNGKFYVFLKAVQDSSKQESDLKQDLSSNKIPRQLQPLADFVKANFATKEEFWDARYNRNNPLNAELRKVSDKVGLGVNKIWSDFGFNNQSEFFDAVVGK